MKQSAGILVYRNKNNKIEVLLVHPGGPYWQNKDKNTWSIPKGEISEKQKLKQITKKSRSSKTKTKNENIKNFFKYLHSHQPLINHYPILLIKKTAIREFKEETSLDLNKEDIKNLKYIGIVKSSNKILYVFVLEKDFGDNFEIKSNLIKIEWPQRSGKFIKIPEVDKASYFDLETAKVKLVNYQKEIVDKIKKILLK